MRVYEKGGTARHSKEAPNQALRVLAAAPARPVNVLIGKAAEPAGRLRSTTTASINCDIWLHVLSHEMPSKNASTLFNHSVRSELDKILSAARMNSSGVSAISTSFSSPYGRTT